jgi:hypothetical protein
MVKHLAGLDCSQIVRHELSFRYLPYSIKQESKPARETLLILGLAVPPWRTRPACAVVVGCSSSRDLSGLVGELSTRSEEFRTLWAAHSVRYHRSGLKDIHHPVVGDLPGTAPHEKL